MIPSPYPLEQDLGICYYASDTPGIGGRLKTEPEDFAVDEIPLPAGRDEGPYLICRLEKRNWELQRAVKQIAKKLGISHRRIAWAGTKDKNAVTTQEISIYRIPDDAAKDLRIRDITLTPLRHSQKSLSLGALAGNRFRIRIRDCSGEHLEDSVRAVSDIVAVSIPNYYGLQRFGVTRPITHLVGRKILKGDYEGAVLAYIGKDYPAEPDETRSARREFSECRDARQALSDLPVQMTYERAMLHHLVTSPDDYAGALRILPPKLLSIFISAWQSYLFNQVISMRLGDGIALTEPLEGDRLLFADGKEDIVSARNRHAAVRQVMRGRCRIAAFIPGAQPYTPTGQMDEYMQHLLADCGLDAAAFKRGGDFVKTRFNGVLRPVSLSTEVIAEIEDGTLGLEFTLPPGHYATTVCREFMKADPRAMI